MRITLPYPPSVNHYWGVSGKRRYIMPRGVAFRETVALELCAAHVEPITGPVRLDIVAHPPDKRRRDLDNLLKALQDALEHGGAFEDDSQVADLRIRRAEPVSGGRVDVEIREEA